MKSSSHEGTRTSDKNNFRKENDMKAGKIKNKVEGGLKLILLSAGMLIILAGIIAPPLTAKARDWFGQPRSADEIVQILTDRLDLSEEQAEAIRPVIAEKLQKIAQIRDKNRTDRRSGRVEIRRLRWDTEMKLGEILSSDQVDKYLELKSERGWKMKRGNFRGAKMGRGFNKTPEEVIERLRLRLDLTDEQAVDIGPIIQESIAKKEAVFDRYREKNMQSRESMRTEMQKIGDETHVQLSTILTDEQMEELNAIQEDKRLKMEKPFNGSGAKGF